MRKLFSSFILIILMGFQSVISKWKQSLLLSISIILLLTLPLSLSSLMKRYSQQLLEQSSSTPRYIAASEGRFDSLMQVLYFRLASERFIAYSDQKIAQKQLDLETIPFYIHHSIRNFPLVAVDPAFYSMMKFEVASGTPPLRLGDCLVGAVAAKKLGLQVGGRIQTDAVDLFDIAVRFPVSLRITGILKKRGESSDEAFFCSLKTGWLADGLAHGHANLSKKENHKFLLKSEKGNLVGNAALKPIVKVTQENLFSFHFHGNSDLFPISGFFLVSNSKRSLALVSAKLDGFQGGLGELRLYKPNEIAKEMLAQLLDFNQIIKAVLWVVVIAVGFLVLLIALLSAQIRKRELNTLFRLGFSKLFVFQFFSVDLLFCLIISVGVSFLISRTIALTPLYKIILEVLI